MEEGIGEVVFEKRNHATRPFSSDSFQQQVEEGIGGGSMSFLPGINQIKERWREYRRPKISTKLVSLFVSTGGEYVAVAAGNEITFLGRDDNYTVPCGIFTSKDRLTTFRHGAWSDTHGVLGVIDSMDTLYLLKYNGEEISRKSKRQLRLPAPLLGLISFQHPNIKGSVLCSFHILTSDGLLHHVEVSKDPRALTSSGQILENHLALQRHFPQNVSCMDFHPQLYLLALVGCGASENSRNVSGSYCLSLWRVTGNLELELLSCSPQLEGQFYDPKSYMGASSTPKVLFSSLGKHLAVLDVSGNLDIFSLDAELHSLSLIAFSERCYSQRGDKFLPGSRRCLHDIVDFTWWCDHIIVLVKKTGAIIMLDIESGTKLLETHKEFSMPVVERVQQSQGCVFILENRLSSDYRGTTGMHDTEIANCDIYNLHNISTLHWSLMSFIERSASEMYTILITNRQFPAALDFANRHGLDKDLVFKAQWLQSDQGTIEIKMFLSNIKDQDFVLSECVNKGGPTEDVVKISIAYGLRLTDAYRFSELEEGNADQIWNCRKIRLQLLQCKDKLETFMGINMGRFSVPEYNKFRSLPLNEAAITLAESGKIGAVNLLFRRHPYCLSPFILDILSAIPEIVPLQTYSQLLPGRSPPSPVALRDPDWVECEKMINFIEDTGVQVRTELILKKSFGFVWPSIAELCKWYKNRARDIDLVSGQLENCLSLLEFASQKGITELKQFHEDIICLFQLIYSDVFDEEMNFTLALAAWEELSDYEKFKMLLKGVKEDTVVGRLMEKAVPFMHSRSGIEKSYQIDSFLVKWLKEIAKENKLEICLVVIEEGFKEFQMDSFFKDEVEAVEIALYCIYSCTLTDQWNTMATILSKLTVRVKSSFSDNNFTPRLGIRVLEPSSSSEAKIHVSNSDSQQDVETLNTAVSVLGDSRTHMDQTNINSSVRSLEKRVKIAEGHVEAGRLLAFYQVPKPMSFFLRAQLDEKDVKQLLRLILSKFGRQPGRLDNDWANMWRDMQSLQESAFPFLDPEYMLTEFCRGLLKAGKFSLSRNYLKGMGSIAFPTEKAETLVIQAAREYFFSASSLACAEIWKAKECLKLFPNSKSVKAEVDVIDVLTLRLPSLGVTLLPMQFRQIRDPMEIIRMVLTSQSGAYLDVEELVDIAKSLGLNSVDDIAAVQEAVAREAALTGDLQQAFDLCLILAKKGHGPIWDLCAAIARGPALDNMDKNSRKKLLGFALSHCDEESIRELLHAWKDLDMQIQCEQLMILTETNPHHIQDAASQGSNADQEIQYKKVIKLLSSVGIEPSGIGFSWDNLVQENGKFLTFAASELPWLLELSQKSKYGKKWGLSSKIPRKQFMSVRAQAVVCILSWLASNDIAPSDDLVASLAKSIMEPPITEHEDIFGCSCLLNLVDAYHGVEVIEEQLRSREDYQEIYSIMNMGLVYSLLNNSGLECLSPYDRRNMLRNKFLEKHESFSSDERDKIDKLQPTFWTEWKSKLEEKKKLTDQARALEQIMPGAETGRFLSRDLKYIESVVFSFIDSAKVIKRPILKEALKLANTYGLDHTEVLLRYLGSALVSEQWTNDDIQAEILDYKEDLRNCSKRVFDMVSLTVYPLIEGCNKLRLAYIYMILSDCCSLLEGIEEPTLLKHRVAAHTHGLELSLFYKILEQECGKVSFIRTLNFKNIAGLGDLNFEHFNQEVYRNINETSVEALARMVEILVGIYKGSVEGLISWQSVYKNYVQILLTNIETATEMKLQCENHGDFKDFIRELEQCYDSCRIYVRALSSGDIVDIIRRCFKLSLSPLVTLSSEQPCPDSLLLLLNFWIRLVDDIKEILSHKDSEEKQITSDLATLSKCLEVFIKLLMEDGVPANLGLSTASNFVNHGLTKLGLTTSILDFCNAMVYSGCDFRAVAEVVFEAVEPSLACTGNHISIQNLPRLYENMLCSIMLDLGDGLSQAQSLHNLLSSLRKLEGNLEVLEMVRYAVWGRLIEFSNNMQLPSHIRVYALELMQSLTGKALRGFPDKLLSDVQPWQGWDESQLMTGGKTGEQGELRQSDNFSRFTETLVALKSTQLAAVLSHDIEITPDDLMTVDNAVSCFLRLSLCASSELDFETLEAILEEWDGLFTGQEDKEKSTETPDNGNKWGPNGWDDEGWESFHEELIDKEGKKDGPLSVHPLHACWEVIIKKLIECSYFDRAMKLIDRLLSKLKSVVLTEDEVQSLSQLAAEIDCVMALKIVLLFPYEAIWFQWLGRIEAKLKHRGSPNTIKVDRELSVLILSSGVLSRISSDSAYRSIFSSFCYSMGNLCCLFQEHQLSLLKDRERGGNITEEIEAMLIFSRILLPYFVSELVLVGQFLLAGFIISQCMHTHASLSHINIAEASLKRYLEGHLYGTLSSGEIAMENKGAAIGLRMCIYFQIHFSRCQQQIWYCETEIHLLRKSNPK